ncbi:hypothetical protein RN001_012082 [Aquatica leii]|uniref:Uncharacterized protein n=1 Tax=Aquatica leii TaxID=1421715 RepID=A0AAN7Q1A8_9COLE|nr:hypothetical protein RN001_012082 [Aquatica leii]
MVEKPCDRNVKDVELIAARLRRVEQLYRLPNSVLQQLALCGYYEDLEKGVTRYEVPIRNEKCLTDKELQLIANAMMIEQSEDEEKASENEVIDEIEHNSLSEIEASDEEYSQSDEDDSVNSDDNDLSIGESVLIGKDKTSVWHKDPLNVQIKSVFCFYRKMGDYEKEQMRLQKLMDKMFVEEETMPVFDDEADPDENDCLAVQDEETDSEQDFESDDEIEANVEPHLLEKIKRPFGKNNHLYCQKLKIKTYCELSCQW